MTMEYKLFDAPQVKMEGDGNGQIAGYASTFANFDDVGERVVAGAFKRHLADFLKDGFIAVGHNWSALPVATPVEAIEDDHGLFVRGDFHSHSAAQDARTVMRERVERGKSVKLSIGYEVLADEYTEEGRLLKDVRLYEWSYVTVPANQMASVTTVKRLSLADESDAVLAAVADYTKRLQDLSALRAKEGRVLSGENRKRIESAVDALAGAMDALKVLLAATEPAKDAAPGGRAEVNALRATWARQQQRLRELGVSI